jgi:hypothetical protein
MEKRYFYQFNGTVFLEAGGQKEAEKLVMDIDLNDYIIDEDLYEIDEDYIPVDLEKRVEKIGTVFHPMEDSAEYEQFKKQVRRMDQADKKEVDAGDLIYQVQMVDLDTKQGKTAKLVPVD